MLFTVKAPSIHMGSVRLPAVRTAMSAQSCSKRSARRTVFLFAVVGLCAQGRLTIAAAADYARDIRPLLMRKCSACHGALRQESGLRLDAAALIHQGGQGGPAIRPGDSAASRLVQAVTGTGDMPRMPPQGESEPLSAADVRLLRGWIDAGAPSPEEEPIPISPEEHWSYQVPQRPSLSPGKNASWAANAIDALISDVHEARGLRPNPPAPSDLMLRRLYVDLLGVTPTRDEREEFLQDDSPSAYERVVDRLLANPQFGERWGRHWMDIWRYADWYGRRAEGEIRYSQHHIWRWRDWIVESLNSDKGYDQMILEMLAGDEWMPTDPQVLCATGFLARNWYKFNRNIWLQETVEHTTAAILALTIKCARCHDHKYEPVSQQEYYRVRAFFEPHGVRTDPVAGQPDITKDGISRVYDADLTAPTYVLVRGDERQPVLQNPLQPGLPAIFGDDALNIQSVSVAVASRTSGENAQPATSSGRRLALARWIIRPDNPRTARVAVNHVWRRHLGAALVPTVANFGLAGRPPSHPKLLDWLAVEFCRQGWSMKWIHRLIVTSKTYRMDAGIRDNPSRQGDPGNTGYWRMNTRRMEAEVIRDSMLRLSDCLDLTIGGPELDEKLGEESARRSLYFRITPDNKMEFLDLFDLANPNECYERRESVIPQQALAIWNSRIALRTAGRLAVMLKRSEPTMDEADFVTAAFQQVLGRGPTNDELDLCCRFLADSLARREAHSNPITANRAAGSDIREDSSGGNGRCGAEEALIHVLLNHNDFVTIR
jgi:hypothetical protein